MKIINKPVHIFENGKIKYQGYVIGVYGAYYEIQLLSYVTGIETDIRKFKATKDVVIYPTYRAFFTAWAEQELVDGRLGKYTVDQMVEYHMKNLPDEYKEII